MYGRDPGSLALLQQSYGRGAFRPAGNAVAPTTPGAVTLSVPVGQPAVPQYAQQRPIVPIAVPEPTPVADAIWGVLRTVSVGLSAYHGYRRNESIGWGIGWGILGGVAPVITPAIAFAQGFGERAKK